MSTETTKPIATYVDVPAVERGVAAKLRAILSDNGVETDSEELSPLFEEVEKLLATPVSDPEEVEKLKKKIQKLRTSPMNQPRTLCRGHLRNTSLPCNAYRFHGYLRLVGNPDPADIAKMLQLVIPDCTAEWVEGHTTNCIQWNHITGENHTFPVVFLGEDMPHQNHGGNPNVMSPYDERIWYIGTDGLIRFQSKGTPLAPRPSHTLLRGGLDLEKIRAKVDAKRGNCRLVVPSRFKVERKTAHVKWRNYVRIISFYQGIPDVITTTRSHNLPCRWAVNRSLYKTKDTMFRLSLRGSYDTPTQYYYIHVYRTEGDDSDEICLVVTDLVTRQRVRNLVKG